MKICTRCLTLHEGIDACPDCGSGLVPYGLWKKQMVTPEPAETSAPVASAPATFKLPPTPKPATEDKKGDRDQGREGEKFVLGIFLSSLGFFIAFVAAYIVVTISK